MRKFLYLILLGLSMIAQAQIPSKPEVEGAVHDFAALFDKVKADELDDRLIAFADSTTNRIVVVTVNDLGGMDAAQFAYKIGEQWGVGDAKFNNGIVILLKPRTEDSSGEIYIAVGYGLEGVVPDATAALIIDREMMPYLVEGDWYGAVKAAVDKIIPMIAGEYSAEEYEAEGGSGMGLVAIIIILLVLYVLFSSKNGKSGGSSGSSNGGGRTIIYPTSSGRSSGGFSGGSFGGGGFSGGFGGGSFGGGGAGRKF